MNRARCDRVAHVLTWFFLDSFPASSDEKVSLLDRLLKRRNRPTKKQSHKKEEKKNNWGGAQLTNWAIRQAHGRRLASCNWEINKNNVGRTQENKYGIFVCSSRCSKEWYAWLVKPVNRERERQKTKDARNFSETEGVALPMAIVRLNALGNALRRFSLEQAKAKTRFEPKKNSYVDDNFPVTAQQQRKINSSSLN